MKRHLFLAISLVFLAACSGSKADVLTTQEHNNKETAEVIEPIPKSVHNKVAIKRHFSSQENLDEFILLLKGDDYSKADLVFCILNHKRDTLFIRHTKGKYLLTEHQNEQGQSVEQQIESIKQEMSTFFASTGFSNPPYTINDPTKEGFNGDIVLWDEIKNDSSAWCFEFSLLGEGKSEVIAYSKTKDTVLVYDATP